MLKESIYHFRDVGAILSLLFYFWMENPVNKHYRSRSGSALFAYDPFTGFQVRMGGKMISCNTATFKNPCTFYIKTNNFSCFKMMSIICMCRIRSDSSFKCLNLSPFCPQAFPTRSTLTSSSLNSCYVDHEKRHHKNQQNPLSPPD